MLVASDTFEQVLTPSSAEILSSVVVFAGLLGIAFRAGRAEQATIRWWCGIDEAKEKTYFFSYIWAC